MRSFKKALMAFAAVTAVSAAFAATSFAEALVADYAEGKVAIKTGLEAASGQMTVLLIEKGADADGITEDEILYINQAAANGNATFGEMGVLGGELEVGKTYTLKVGSDADGFTLLSYDIAIKGSEEEDVWCDINVDFVVDIDDVTRLVRHLADMEPLDYVNDVAQYVARGDVNKDTVVDIDDVTRLVRHLADMEPIEGLVMNKK